MGVRMRVWGEDEDESKGEGEGESEGGVTVKHLSCA